MSNAKNLQTGHVGLNVTDLDRSLAFYRAVFDFEVMAEGKEDGRRWGIPGKPFEPDRWLEDEDEVTLGTLTLGVRHCPGHTPGHVVFHHPVSKLAIVGDVLFKGSIGRWDFPKGDHGQLINSITQRLWPMGGETMFIPGHGPVSTFGHERATNPLVGDAALAA